MHADEVETDVSLVRRLLAAQFPHWVELALERVPSFGTDNALYRLGDDLVVRLPRIHWAVGGVEKDLRWLPVLAPLLPFDIPQPLAKGVPAEGYPWEWGVYRWLEGEDATVDHDPESLARDVARFVAALQRVDVAGAPPAVGRGEPLATRDEATRSAIAELEGTIDTAAATAAWDAALATSVWAGPPVWVHGDLLAGNLLLRDGRLTGVIDWSGTGVGDPAADLIVAWSLFEGESRDVFRTELDVDDATWERGRGLALSVGVLQLPYYRQTNPVLAGIGRRAIDEVLASLTP